MREGGRETHGDKAQGVKLRKGNERRNGRMVIQIVKHEIG